MAQTDRLYIYGFARAPLGAMGESLAWVEGPGSAALCSPWAGPEPALDRPLLLDHLRVTERACQAGAFVPCRAGTVETAEGLTSWMAANAGRLQRAVENLVGMVEFTLRFRPPTGAPAASGRSYLVRLSQQAQARRSLTSAFLGALGGLPAAVERGEHQVELLVPRDRATQVRRAFEEADRVGVGATLSGPWPPYHFAGVMVHGREDGAPTPAAERLAGGGGAGAGPAGSWAGGTGAPAPGA